MLSQVKTRLQFRDDSDGDGVQCKASSDSLSPQTDPEIQLSQNTQRCFGGGHKPNSQETSIYIFNLLKITTLYSWRDSLVIENTCFSSWGTLNPFPAPTWGLTTTLSSSSWTSAGTKHTYRIYTYIQENINMHKINKSNLCNLRDSFNNVALTYSNEHHC